MGERPSPPGIVIYGVGRFGTRVARLAAQRGWPIVAALNRSGPKIGRDLGRLIGLDRNLGVLVQDCDTADYAGLAGLAADIGIVTVSDRLETNWPAYRRLLGAGMNVICLGGEATYPAAVDPALCREIDDLARANGVTFTGCSIWDTYRIWLLKTLVGPCTELRALHHSSVTIADRFGPDVLRKIGVGLSVAEFEKQLQDIRQPSVYGVMMKLVVDSLGFRVCGVEERREPVVWDESLPSSSLGREVEAGLSIGSRYRIALSTEEGLVATASLETRLTRPDERELMRWKVDGEPSCELVVDRGDSRHSTASSIVNRIEDVIAAPPGVVTVDRLGPMRFPASTARH